jgi:hypothetical protein
LIAQNLAHNTTSDFRGHVVAASLKLYRLRNRWSCLGAIAAGKVTSGNAAPITREGVKVAPETAQAIKGTAQNVDQITKPARGLMKWIGTALGWIGNSIGGKDLGNEIRRRQERMHRGGSAG